MHTDRLQLGTLALLWVVSVYFSLKLGYFCSVLTPFYCYRVVFDQFLTYLVIKMHKVGLEVVTLVLFWTDMGCILDRYGLFILY